MYLCIPKNFLEMSDRVPNCSAQQVMNGRKDCSKVATAVRVEFMSPNTVPPGPGAF